MAFCVLASAAAARAEEWQRMGQAYVDFRSNPVVVSVSTDAGAVSKIKVQVKESALEVRDVKVFLAGGESFDVTVDTYIGAGKETRPIDVPGGPKAIEKVEVKYRGGSSGEPMPLLRVLGES
jgi:hypothetical protein